MYLPATSRSWTNPPEPTRASRRIATHPDARAAASAPRVLVPACRRRSTRPASVATWLGRSATSSGPGSPSSGIAPSPVANSQPKRYHQTGDRRRGRRIESTHQSRSSASALAVPDRASRAFNCMARSRRQGRTPLSPRLHLSLDCVLRLRTLFTAATCRKLNRIPPLDQVFHLFALVNLMNEFGCVVYQTHRHLARNSGASQPVDIGDSQTVKTKVGFLHFDEELLPSPRRLEREFQCISALLICQPLQQWFDRGRHWNRERPVFAPLRMGEGDFVFIKVHTVEWNPRFPKFPGRSPLAFWPTSLCGFLC